MDTGDTSLRRVEHWTEKFRDSLHEQVQLQLQANPGADAAAVQAEFLLNKIAVLTVACEDIGNKLREMETRIDQE